MIPSKASPMWPSMEHNILNIALAVTWRSFSVGSCKRLDGGSPLGWLALAAGEDEDPPTPVCVNLTSFGDRQNWDRPVMQKLRIGFATGSQDTHTPCHRYINHILDSIFQISTYFKFMAQIDGLSLDPLPLLQDEENNFPIIECFQMNQHYPLYRRTILSCQILSCHSLTGW